MDDKIKQSLIDIVKSCENVALGTLGLNEYPEIRTVMNALNKNAENLNLHFITSIASPKYEQLQNNSNVCLYYFNSDTHMAMRLFGKIITHQDEISRAKYWNDNWKMYGYADANDPKYCVLEFQPESYKFYQGPAKFTGIID